MRSKLQFIVLATGALGLWAAPAASATINVQIINQSGRPDRRVYVMLDGGSSSDGRLSRDVGTRLSSLRGHRFALTNLSGGRIFFSYGSPVTNAEPARAPTRYDKVELTYPGVVNLTAVDFFGIPFRLQARNGAGRTLGTLAWKAPTNTIKHAMLEIPGARRALVKT